MTKARLSSGADATGGIGRATAGDRPRAHNIWQKLGPHLLPFADVATAELPLKRLLRLALFQVSVGMAMVLLNATLNRVMIVELGVAASIVATMVALPLLFAPLRVLIGHRSDTHRSVLGWRRVPYLWLGTILQFGGLAIMPFALIVLSGDSQGPTWLGPTGAALAFLLTGAGLHMTQTAGLALATDLADESARPRIVALLYVMLLIGMVVSALLIGWLLADFSQKRLIQVIQGAAVVTMLLNFVAAWKQEARQPHLTSPSRPRLSFKEGWQTFARHEGATRLLVTVALGAAAFSMQDILLEPYGAEVLGLSVGATTQLTAIMALGTLLGFGLAARALGEGRNACLLAAQGAAVGLVAFPLIILSDPLGSPFMFRMGTFAVGIGQGMFAVGTLTAAMALGKSSRSGMALGAWGAVQATAAGLALAAGGTLRDLVGGLAADGALGPINAASAGYMFVYHIEILLIFVALAAVGPLVKFRRSTASDVAKAHQRHEKPVRGPVGIPDFPT